MKKNRIYRFLTSVRLAIILLIIIALLCIICTLIPQNQPEINYAQQYGEFWASVITALGFDQILTSGWMYASGLLFGINLFLCTWERLRWAVACNKRDSQIAVWGSPILHLGLCIILIGAFIGMNFGWELYYEIPVGESASISTGQGAFQMKIEDFTIDFYDDRITPRQYRSDILIQEADGEAIPMEIEVNSPAKHNGISILQQDFGWEVTVTVSTDKVSEQFRIKNEDWIVLAGQGDEAVSLGIAFYPDYDESAGLTDQVGYRDDNPHIVWVLRQGDNPVDMNYLAVGETGTIQEPLRISFDSYRYYSGLQVRYDPGIPVIYTGFFLLCLGLVIRYAFANKMNRDFFGKKGENR